MAKGKPSLRIDGGVAAGGGDFIPSRQIHAAAQGCVTPTGRTVACVVGYTFCEETIFRGYIQLRLNSYLGAKWGWLATAGLFLLWQLPGRLWLFPVDQLWQPVLIATVQGLLCGWMMKKTGHVASSAIFRAFSGWILSI
jgi:membrane protease YdiL (CAAX protease family)